MSKLRNLNIGSGIILKKCNYLKSLVLAYVLFVNPNKYVYSKQLTIIISVLLVEKGKLNS